MEKSNVFSNNESLKCNYCGKDLMENINTSMVLIATNKENKITRFQVCCKGECDHSLKNKFTFNETDGWQELSEFFNPYFFIKYIMAIMNNMYDGTGFENKEAFESFKEFILKCYPYVTRNLSEAEKSNIQFANMLPF